MNASEIARQQLYEIIEGRLSEIFGNFIGNGVTIERNKVENQPEDLLVTVHFSTGKEIIFLIDSREGNSSIVVTQNDILDRSYMPTVALSKNFIDTAQQYSQYIKDELSDTLHQNNLGKVDKDFLKTLIN